MRSLLLAVIMCGLAVPVVAHAQARPKVRRSQLLNTSGGIKLIDNVALNAAAGSRTITATTKDMYEVILQVDLTRGGSVTPLIVTPTCSLNDGASYANINSGSISSGTSTLSTYTLQKAVSTSVNEIYQIPVPMCDMMQFVVSGTSGGASDFITVYGFEGVP